MLTVETEVNGDSTRTNDKDPFLVGSVSCWIKNNFKKGQKCEMVFTFQFSITD